MALAAPLVAGVAGLEVISSISDIWSLGTMFVNTIAPAPKTPQNTIVRVLLGQDLTSDTSFGGNVPGVSLWDFVGNPVGHTPGTKQILPQGAFVDIEVEPQPEIGNVQSHYISITNGGENAICVSGFTVTFPDGGKAGFNANAVAGTCDADWNNAQNSVISGTPNDGSPQARCIWIDGNGSSGLRFQGFAVHLPSFSTQANGLGTEYTQNTDLMCKSGPRWRMYSELTATSPIIRYDPPLKFLTEQDTSNSSLIGGDADTSIIINNPGLETGFFSRSKKREALEAQGWSRIQKKWPILRSAQNSTSWNSTTGRQPMHGTVVISPHAYNSARTLCESSTSRGTSFVSLVENLFCDMEDKLLYHICESGAAASNTSCCYDTSKDTLLACEQEPTDVVQQNAGSTWVHTPVNFVAEQHAESVGMQNGKTFKSVHRW